MLRVLNVFLLIQLMLETGGVLLELVDELFEYLIFMNAGLVLLLLLLQFFVLFLQQIVLVLEILVFPLDDLVLKVFGDLLVVSKVLGSVLLGLHLLQLRLRLQQLLEQYIALLL